MSRNASISAKPPRRDADGRSPLELAVRAHRAGRLNEAERGYRAVKRRDSDYAEALRLRGVLAHQRQHPDEAIKLLRRAVAAQPSNPVAHHSLAEILRATGWLEAAAEAYRRAYALAPGRHATGLDLADTLAAAGDSEAALAVLATIVGRQPDHAGAREYTARLHHERGDPAAARAELEAWIAATDASAATRRRQAAAFSGIGDAVRAGALYRAVLAEDDDDSLAHAGLGVALQSQGAFKPAKAAFEHAIELRCDLGWVHAALMSDREYLPAAEHEHTMRRLLNAPETGVETRTQLNFALGALHDRRGEHVEAFTHFERGNRIQAALAPFDASRFDARIERILAYFDAGALDRHRHVGHPTDKPIFVVGMPRSGTSLVEQILASHPQVFGAGELDDMRRMVRELPALSGGRKPFPQCLDDLTAEQTGALAARYLGALDARAPDAARVTDKMPFNMLWLGLIARLFPNARVVYCRRDAMDNSLSCYFQLFSKGLRFTYDLGHLGHVYRQHERLMAHWRECLPLDMLTVDYELLVRDPETQIRRLIAFAGLDWDDRCLASHRTARDVRTASVWQVRQPVYQSSVARWRAYEPWLQALRDSLAAPIA